MNIPTTEELESLRVVVGNNTTTAHPVLGTIPVKGTFPMEETMSGLATTDNAGTTAGLIVMGDEDTRFLDELNEGDFLSDGLGHIRRIKFIMSQNMLELEAKFASDLTADPVLLVRKNGYRSILAHSTGSANAVLNDQVFEPEAKFFNDGAPVAYDVSTASCEISFTLSI